MLIIGLTGSIGMGKSTAARYLLERGIPVFDADAEVHRLYEAEGAAAIEAAFPGTVRDGKVDRGRLAQAVLGDPAKLARLESLVHPLIREAERAFIDRHAAQGAAMIVLEVPLLLETGLDQWVDATVVLTAPAEIQRQRVLARPGMTPQKLDSLLSHQLPEAEKLARADFVVDTSGPVEETRRQIDRVLESLKTRQPRALRRWRDEVSRR